MKKLITFIAILFVLPVSSQFWQAINIGGGGWFERVSVDFDGNIYAASDLSGAYVSRDNGSSWSIIAAKHGMTSTHVAGFGMSPLDSSVVFIATEEGVFKSTDGGLNFTHPLINGYIETIAVANNSVAYAAYHSDYNIADGSIYKTVDGGNSWVELNNNLPNNLRIIKLIVETNQPQHLYLLSGEGRFATGVQAAYRSLDGGVSWMLISDDFTENVVDIAIDLSNPQIIWVTVNDADINMHKHLYKSTDFGLNFSHVFQHGGVIWLDANNSQHIRLFDSQRQFDFVGEDRDGVWESLDGGVSWNQISDAASFGLGWTKIFHTRTTSPHSVAIYNNSLFWVNDQTIYASFDGGLTVQQLYTNEVSPNHWSSTGIDNAVIVELEADKIDNNVLWAGFIDMGVWRSDDQGASWQSCNRASETGVWEGFGGNSWTIETDSDRDGYVWTMQSEDEIGPAVLLRSSNRGGSDCQSWSVIGSGLPASPLLGLSLDLSEFNPTQRTMYISANGDVYRSINDGDTWTMVLANGGMRTTAVSQNGTVFAGGENGIFRSIDGVSFTNITLAGMTGSVNDLPVTDGWTGVSSIVPNPGIAFPNRLWVVVHGVGIYKSEDNGDNWQLMLTDPFVWELTVSMHDDGHMFASSSSAFDHGGYDSNSKGMWESKDSGQSWQNTSNNLDWPFALSVEFSPDNDYTYIGSPGAGIFRHNNFDLLFEDGFEN